MFRQEVSAARATGGLGSVRLENSLALNVAIALVAVFGLAMLCASMALPYSHHAIAPGWTRPSQGVVKIVCQTSGTLGAIRVREGVRVKKGDVIAVIDTDRASVDGNSLYTGSALTLSARRDHLSDQISLTRQQRKIKSQDIAKKLRALETDRALAAHGLDLTRQRVELAADAARQADELLQSGLITRTQRRDRADAFIELQSQEQATLRTIAGLDRAKDEAVAEAQTADRQADIDISHLEQDRLVIDGEMRANGSRQREVLVASEDGEVATINAVVGDALESGQTVASIARTPNDRQDRPLFDAVVYLPSRSSDLLRQGQDVWLSYDALSAERYGRQHARISSLSSSPIDPSDIPAGRRQFLFKGGNEEPLFRVDLKVDDQWIGGSVVHRTPSLGSGLVAEFVLERKSVFDWLFERVRGFKSKQET